MTKPPLDLKSKGGTSLPRASVERGFSRMCGRGSTGARGAGAGDSRAGLDRQRGHAGGRRGAARGRKAVLAAVKSIPPCGTNWRPRAQAKTLESTSREAHAMATIIADGRDQQAAASVVSRKCRPPLRLASGFWSWPIATKLRSVSNALREGIAAHRHYEHLRSRGIPHDAAIRQALGISRPGK